MDKEETLTPEAFASLLGWLGSDEHSAVAKYEDIRARLIKVFVGRGCTEAEVLADRTFDRVAQKLSELNGTYLGNPIPYFYAVAKNILYEWKKEPKPVSLLGEPRDLAFDAVEQRRNVEKNCFNECLASLPKEDRKLIVDYYRGDKIKKIENRKIIAEKLGISAEALQMRAYRLRTRLATCVNNCADEK